MRLAIALCAMTLLASTAPAGSNPSTPEANAQSAALAWLALVDAQEYAESWSDASSQFRQRISSSQWQAAVANARAPLGALQSRVLQSATPMSTLPGAPDGRYVVIQFAAVFEHKANATETVTPMLDSDGRWHVSGYYVR